MEDREYYYSSRLVKKRDNGAPSTKTDTSAARPESWFQVSFGWTPQSTATVRACWRSPISRSLATAT